MCVFFLSIFQNLKRLLGVDAKKKDQSVSNVQKENNVIDNSCNEEAKKIAAAALAAVRNATAAAASSRGKIEVRKLTSFCLNFVCLARHC